MHVHAKRQQYELTNDIIEHRFEMGSNRALAGGLNTKSNCSHSFPLIAVIHISSGVSLIVS